MKNLMAHLIFVSLLLVLALKNADSLNNDEPALEKLTSDEIDESVRNRKDTGILNGQFFIPSPIRRHHLKFGVLGKRYSYGYLGKRNNDGRWDDHLEQYFHDVRERRAGRPQYGMLG